MAPLSLSAVRASDAAALTIADVAAVLGVDVRTVSKGIEAGTIPSVRLGRRVLIPREKFLALWTADPAPEGDR
ncbi:helix-turn-helix domain-containing protein [Rhodococcus pyridinivorans]|uniref:helix-turn-helix domain-containing protein n=1 Tax=Rhodococcus pyridinivorans TaxID=103816 RepID=UPI003446F373